MEQRIGPTSPPVHAAGTDPAAIPGLTTPSAAGPETAAPEPQAADEAPGTAADGTTVDEAAAGQAAEEPEAATETAAEPETADKPEEGEPDEGEPEEGEPEPDGPAFRVSDRRASIAADHTGITFRLDTEEAEFSWDEIRAVAIDTPRFGRRFAVTVYTGPRRWFENDVEAKSKSLLKKWTAELDAVLDRYFEDGDHGDHGGHSTDSADEADATDATDATNATDAADVSDTAAAADTDTHAKEKSEA